MTPLDRTHTTAITPTHAEGKADAMTGAEPASRDPDYIKGYAAGIAEMLLNQPQWHLQIRWVSDSFRRGAYD